MQVIPIKEIGKTLYKITAAEDLDEDYSDECCKSKKEMEPYFFQHEKNSLELQFQPYIENNFIAHDERLLAFHLPDTLTPPPDCIFCC